MQCFLWQDLDVNKLPETLKVIINNIGVKPARSIAMTALYKSADFFKDKYRNTVQ